MPLYLQIAALFALPLALAIFFAWFFITMNREDAAGDAKQDEIYRARRMGRAAKFIAARHFSIRRRNRW